MIIQRSPQTQFVLALIFSSLVSLGFYAYGAWRNQNLTYGFMFWNLFLAWVPLLLAIRLRQVLKTKLWSSWEALATSFAWLIFLPNSFYLVSDLIHLTRFERIDVLYDVVMLTSFIVTGLVLGFSSLFLIHLQLKRRLQAREAAVWIGLVLFLCSIAIYLGRDLRWNSWDILTNPGGLLFDISERFQHPAQYPQMLLTITSFFVLLGSMYYLLWCGTRLLQNHGRSKS